MQKIENQAKHMWNKKMDNIIYKGTSF